MQPTSQYPPRCLPLLAFAAGGPDVPLPFTRCRPAACTIRGTPMTRLGAYLASCIVLLTIFVSAWAAQGDIVSVDNWAEYPVGALLLSVPGPWKVYSSMKVFKYPPTVVLDDARRVFRLRDHQE